MTPRPPRRAGFVLVSVLSVMAIVAALVGAVLMVNRSAVGLTRIAVDQLVTDALGRAGLELAAYQLLVRQQRPAEIDGQQVRLDDGTVTLFVTVPVGLIDVNRAPPDLLAAAYRAAGLERTTPEEFARRVTDWRDADPTTEAGADEAAEYELAGVPYRPANRDFRTVDEVRWVIGVAPGDVAALKPLLTVANPTGTVNLFDAPAPVLGALGIRPADVRRLLALRQKRDEATAERLRLFVEGFEESVVADPGPAPIVRVRVETRPNAGPPRIVEATITTDPTGRQPYLVVER